MSAKKEIRSDGTYLVEGTAVKNPKLYARQLSDGRERLFLVTYSYETDRETKRKKVKYERNALDLYLWSAPRTPQERADNKEVLELAKRIQWNRGQELKEEYERQGRRKSDVCLVEYYEEFLQGYTKKDKRNMSLALTRFKAFIEESNCKYKAAEDVRLKKLDKDLMSRFADYLQEHGKGEGPLTLWKRFRKVIRHAVEHGDIAKDPTSGITLQTDEGFITKDILSADEIEILMQTHVKQENPIIRKAFLFSLNTGIRWCDIKDLTFADVDRTNKMLKFEQNKTRGHSKSSNVVIPLRDDLLSLIGEGNKEELIFPLPSHTMCLKALRHWVEKAGIDKHITWHCARHTFGTNLVLYGADIVTTSALLGHSSLRHTQKYVRAVDEQKRKAINALPAIITDKP